MSSLLHPKPVSQMPFAFLWAEEEANLRLEPCLKWVTALGLEPRAAGSKAQALTLET